MTLSGSDTGVQVPCEQNRCAEPLNSATIQNVKTEKVYITIMAGQPLG